MASPPKPWEMSGTTTPLGEFRALHMRQHAMPVSSLDTDISLVETNMVIYSLSTISRSLDVYLPNHSSSRFRRAPTSRTTFISSIRRQPKRGGI